MRMSISRKLVGGFLGLALLVLIAGLVGIIVLNKVSASADTVAKEKAPTQYAVMNAALAVDIVQKHTVEFVGAVFELDTIDKVISEGLEKFEMWVTILQFGTDSAEFSSSPAKEIFREKNKDLYIPPVSGDMLPVVMGIVENTDRLKEGTSALMAAHRELVSYGVVVEGHMLSLPDFLNLAQRDHLEWVKQIKDAVNIETVFTGNTDPTKGLIGNWLETYQVPDEELMELHAKFKIQYDKMMKMAEKINSLTVFKDKQRTLNRGIGITAKIESYFSMLHENEQGSVR